MGNEFTKEDILNHWKFPEIEDPNLSVIGLDPSVGWLNIATDQVVTDLYQGPGMISYVFHPTGHFRAVRRAISESNGDGSGFGYLWEFRGEIPMRLWVSGEPNFNRLLTLLPHPLGFGSTLAEVYYTPQNELREITSGDIFCVHPEKGMVDSPKIVLDAGGRDHYMDYTLKIGEPNPQGYQVAPTPIFDLEGFGYAVSVPGSELPVYLANWKAVDTLGELGTGSLRLSLNCDGKVIKRIIAPLT